MLDLAYVRTNLPVVEQKLRDRGMDPAAALGEFAAIDAHRRQAITSAENLKAQRNGLNDEIAMLRRNGADASAQMEETKRLKSQGDSVEASAIAADDRLRELMQILPNLPQDSVPIGKSEHDNRVEKVWDGDEKLTADGSPDTAYTPAAPAFPAQPHWEIGERLGILDFERAAKISGSRFVVHYGQGARLERALANFMLDLHTREHGYTEVLPPYMVNSKSLFGTGQLPSSRKTSSTATTRAPTSPESFRRATTGDSHGRGPRHQPLPRRDAGRVATDHQLLRLHALLPVEAGSYGKDVRGMIRQHQFQKVELVKFCRPRGLQCRARAPHPGRRARARTPWPALSPDAALHRRHGLRFAKTYDLEVWLPGQNLYREISSCSNFEAFQARRANIRFRPAGSAGIQKVRVCAYTEWQRPGRRATYLAVLENYQQADGTVRIPEALLPYMNDPRAAWEWEMQHRTAKASGQGANLWANFYAAISSGHTSAAAFTST